MVLYVRNDFNNIWEIAAELGKIKKEALIGSVTANYDKESKKYKVVIRPCYEDATMSLDGFTEISGTCKTCLHYSGASTHYFGRGWLGECLEYGGQHPVWYQCEDFKDKAETFRNFRKAVADAKKAATEKKEEINSADSEL